MERISDCERWKEQGHAVYVGEALCFTQKFLDAVARERLTSGKFSVGDDDGIQRRWTRAESGSPAKGECAIDGQLLGLVILEDGQKREGKIVTSPAGIGVKQLLPIGIVGTGRHVAKQADELVRRQHRRDKGRQVQPAA